MLESREWERAKECVCLSPCCALLCVVFVLVNCLRIYWENKLIKKEKKKVRFDLFILVLGRGITLWNDLQHPRLYIYYSYSYSYTALPKITYYYYSIYTKRHDQQMCAECYWQHTAGSHQLFDILSRHDVYTVVGICVPAVHLIVNFLSPPLPLTQSDLDYVWIHAGHYSKDGKSKLKLLGYYILYNNI
jgi:hypothetical protein